MRLNFSEMLDKLIPITRFNQGQASKYFSRANKGESFIVIRNNVPVSVILSPEEYRLLRDLVSACQKANLQTDSELTLKISPLLEQIQAFEDKGHYNE